ncbi:ubiquinone/menaquinone biosynthesis C-methylase UbiE [Priestia taiwanensis]|uniref:Methyltransferase n=2 Tax=Priestia taiwanensis TaxID=1347902 RepID=A0A917AJJ2_9BACI|nr:class I SAM-dependent methyltransferase [Priestia taiwanensis]MBM7361894.1 ubiquinone/menaquinone biosynthesis C-methylase UbiE [Priestia taiwanensis]GGE57802.1 methyltransferase [Priestia taiwanensis]
MTWLEQGEKLWNENASFWSNGSKHMWDNGSRSGVVPFMKKYVPQGANILDVGCGDGYGSYLLAKEGYNVVGMDYSGEMVNTATGHNKEKNVSFVKGDMCHMPFEDGTFASIMAITSVEWTESPLQAVQEFYRVLEDGGKCCVAILGPTAKPRERSYQRLYGEKVVCNTMMPWEFGRLACENGFVHIDGYGVYKRGVEEICIADLSISLKQSLSFMWVFMLEKKA